MSWRPNSSAHAIERVRLVIIFKQPIPAKVSRHTSEMMSKLRADTRLDGPSPRTSFGLNVQVSPGGQQIVTAPHEALQGWQFLRTATTTGFPLEAVVLEQNQIVYETVEYRRWETFLQRYSKVFSPIADYISNALDIDRVALEYFDRFHFEGPSVEASPRTLLSGIDTLIAKEAAAGQKLWHLHRGWFEGSRYGDVLINQNLDAVDAVPQGHTVPVRTIGILTKAEVRSENFRLDDVGRDQILEILHNLTHMYFRSALQEEILPTVGIS